MVYEVGVGKLKVGRNWRTGGCGTLWKLTGGSKATVGGEESDVRGGG